MLFAEIVSEPPKTTGTYQLFFGIGPEFCVILPHATQTAQNNPPADARSDLGDRRSRRSVPHFRRRPHARYHRVDPLHVGQVRCQSDLFRPGQERGDVPRPLPAHRRCRSPRGQPHLFPSERLGHEPGALHRRRGFRQRSDPQRSVPASLRPHHPGAGAFPGSALQVGDVGRHLARLQPHAFAPRMSEECRQAPRSRCDRRFPRQRKGFPQHALRLAAHAREDPPVRLEMQGHRVVGPMPDSESAPCLLGRSAAPEPCGSPPYDATAAFLHFSGKFRKFAVS